jgi:hypothetical protein
MIESRQETLELLMLYTTEGVTNDFYFLCGSGAFRRPED